MKLAPTERIKRKYTISEHGRVGFKVGVQTFYVEGYRCSKREGEWMRDRLATALAEIIKLER